MVTHANSPLKAQLLHLATGVGAELYHLRWTFWQDCASPRQNPPQMAWYPEDICDSTIPEDVAACSPGTEVGMMVGHLPWPLPLLALGSKVTHSCSASTQVSAGDCSEGVSVGVRSLPHSSQIHMKASNNLAFSLYSCKTHCSCMMDYHQLHCYWGCRIVHYTMRERNV